jgi:hypothetical protein
MRVNGLNFKLKLMATWDSVPLCFTSGRLRWKSSASLRDSEWQITPAAVTVDPKVSTAYPCLCTMISGDTGKLSSTCYSSGTGTNRDSIRTSALPVGMRPHSRD